jgi:hypothetical protein
MEFRALARVLILTLSTLIPVLLSGQIAPHQAGKLISSPVKYAFSLSGSFGELRNTHFHAGIDIRPSSSQENDRIYSIADGYIQRIRLQTGGYGKSIYILHPQLGYTTVYAHLDRYNEDIESYVAKIQKARKSYAVNIDLPAGLFKIKKGEYLGIMGNTGQSFGTHLHFEIRDSKTEKPINPFLFGLKPPDNLPPSLLNVAVHGLDQDFLKTEQIILPVPSEQKQNMDLPVTEMVSDRIGIAVECFDRMTGAPNKNGIYKLRLYTEDSLLYSFGMDKISYGEMNQIAGFIDYPQKQSLNDTYTLCYKLPGVTLDFLRHNSTGIIKLEKGKSHYYCVEVEDFEQNITAFEWYVRKLESPVLTEDIPVAPRVKMGAKWIHDEADCTVVVNENSLFRNIYFQFETLKDSICNPCYRIHNASEPLRSNIEIKIKSDQSTPNFRNKAIIVRKDALKGDINHGGNIMKDEIVTGTRFFGIYALEYDTIAPSVLPVSFNKKATSVQKFSFEIKDNLETAGSARDISYKVWIDNDLIICPYKPLTKILDIPLKDIPSGNHNLKIQVTDHSGNTTIYRNNFTN